MCTLLVAAAASLTLALSACVEVDPVAVRPSTVIVHVPAADEWLFGPAQADEPMSLLFLPLAHASRNGEIEGRLAQSWEHSDDRRRWTIHLRSDVRWHDGVPFTAHDVAFTAELLMHPDIARIAPGAFTVTVIDDSTYTVDIHTNDERAMVTPGSTRTGYFFPRHLLSELDPSEFFVWDFWLHPIGNGPYRYVRHVPSTLIELEANGDFYLGMPMIERVVLKLGTGSQLAELESRSVDVALYVEWADLLKLEGDPDLRAYWSKDTNVFMGIMWNLRHDSLSDPRVRRALTMAIDRAGLHDAINLPAGAPVFDGVFTERQFWRGEYSDPLPHDADGALRLLAEAGWIRAASGKLEKDGRGLELSCLVMAEDAINVTAAIHVQDQLRDLGIELQLEPLEPGVLNERAGRGDFDAILGEVLTRPSGLVRRFGPNSFLGYHDDRVTALLEEMEHTLDPETSDRLYAALSQILIEDMPMTALFPDYEVHVAHRRLAGLSSPHRSVALRHMEELRLQKLAAER